MDANILVNDNGPYNVYNSPYLYVGKIKANLGATDPSFINASGNNYHVYEGSLSINNGLNVGLGKDLNGNSIVGNPDIGVFEFAQNSAPNIYFITGLNRNNFSIIFLQCKCVRNTDSYLLCPLLLLV